MDDPLEPDNARIWREHARPLQAAHFDPLCRELDLTLVPCEGLMAAQGYVSATGGDLRVHFENDRGLCYFALGPAAEAESLCSVEHIARLFPRVRMLTPGTQRLALDEQARFIADHWAELQSLLSPGHISETRRSLRVADHSNP